LPGRIGHRHRIGGVVDDNSVVDVVVDEVVRRRLNVSRRIDPHRYRHIHRNGQDIFIDRRRRRRQVDEIDRPRRQEKHRWRWWRFKSKIRIVENQHRPFDVNHLFRRRRQHIVADDFESRRRLEGSRQICQTAPRIVGVQATGVTAQIRPVSRRRIHAPTAPPGDGLAAGGNDGSHASRHRIARIGGEEVFIVRQRVAIERGEISLPRVKVSDGS
jgi:hypothetical protein